MKTYHNSLILLQMAIAIFSASLVLNAQSPGSVSGKVSDKNYNGYLEGVIVRTKDGSRATSTNRFGEYTLRDVNEGENIIVFSYMGYARESRPVTVTSAKSTHLDVRMGERIIQLEAYTISASQEIGQARAINQQKTAKGIVNIISEEVFGSMLEGNVGQALQRMPGISVDESQDGSQGSINIRGIAGEFNSVQIDGNRIPSSGGSRSFNPRQFAADGVTYIEIVKAPTPDRDGDAIGGIINLITRSAFQREGREMKLKLASILNEEPNKWGFSGGFSFSDLFSVGGGKNNLGISFSLSSYDTNRFSLNADQDWIQVTPENNPELNMDEYDEPVWFFESTHFEHATHKTKTQTISGSIDFQANDYNMFYIRPMISYFERNGVSYETDIDIDTRFQNKVGGRKTYAALTPTYGRATEDSEGSRGWIGTLEDQNNLLYSFSVGGEYKREDSLLTYDIFFSKNKRTVDDDTELNTLMEPEDPGFIMEYEIIDPNGDVEVNIVNGVDPADLSQMTEGELEFVSSEKTEEVLSAKMDWVKTFIGDRGIFNLKIGAKLRKSNQEFDEQVDLYEMDETFPYASVLEATDEILFRKPKYFNVQPQAGKDLFASNPELFKFVEDDSLEDSNVGDYDAEETTTAAYVMGTYEWGPHTIIAGVRWEKNKWDNVNKQVSYLDDIPSVTSINQGSSYSFWLPGVHLRHELSENVILRESYNRSYGRPRLSELSRGRWVDDEGNIEDGNPNLKPAISDNFDAQIEYYTDQGGLYSVGIFYKNIEDFTYTQVYNFNELNASGIPIVDDGGDFEYERPLNGAGATNYGLELILRQHLYFLPGPLNGLSAAISATFTESDADYPNRDDDRDLPLEGFSSELYTFTLDYALGDFSARVDYRYRGDYIEGLGDNIESDEFYAAEYRVDAEATYQLQKGLFLFATASNLTDEPQVSYQGYSQFVEDASFAGRKFTFGVEYNF